MATSSRLEAFARLRKLNADLLRASSATRLLERWCGVDRSGITARVLHVAPDLDAPDLDAPDLGGESRALLELGTEQLRHRRVQLLCGERVLSDADNWYVPARLSPEANRAITETDTPFGRAIEAQPFRRVTLSAALLWHPTRGRVPWHVLRHAALLHGPDSRPFSLVVETYTAELLRP